MSDEQRDHEETEVEAHGNRTGAPRVGAPRVGMNDEPDDEVEGHVNKAG